MKYALVNDKIQQAQPGLLGKCPSCENATISKCGKIKIPHWAHKGKLMCDPWWENETEWHRAWKNCFPEGWQEVIHIADNGEKHISDVKTSRGLVIEFQHSSIKFEESNSRENFYKNMIWIIDGARRKHDKKKFILAWQWSKPLGSKSALRELDTIFGNECALIRDWSKSKVPVFFDFGDEILYGLLPMMSNGILYAFEINRNFLIDCLRSAIQISFEQLISSIIGSIKITMRQKQLTFNQSNFRPRISLVSYNSYSRFQRRRHWPL